MILGGRARSGSVIAVPVVGMTNCLPMRQAALDRDELHRGGNLNRQQDEDANAGTAKGWSREVEPYSELVGRQWHLYDVSLKKLPNT